MNNKLANGEDKVQIKDLQKESKKNDNNKNIELKRKKSCLDEKGKFCLTK